MVLAAYRFIESASGKRALNELQDNIAYFDKRIKEKGLSQNFIQSNSAIKVCKVAGNNKVKNISIGLANKGFDVFPILSPTVAMGHECLRFCVHAFNTKNEIEQLLEVVKSMLNDE